MARSQKEQYYAELIEAKSSRFDSAVGKNVRLALEHKDIPIGEMASTLGADKSRMTRLLKGEYTFTPYELSLISEKLNIPLEQLLYGVAPENRNIQRQTGLSTYAIDWLHKIHKEDEHIAEMVNFVLSNDAIAEALFSMMYYYCVVNVLPRQKRSNVADDFAYAIASGDTLLNLAITDFFKRIFDQVRMEYSRKPNTTHSRELDEKMAETLSRICRRFEQHVDRVVREVRDETLEFKNEMDEHNAAYSALHQSTE